MFTVSHLRKVYAKEKILQTTRYAIVTFLASLLEALSVQNDNLTLPLYMWSMLVVVGV
jgi:dolichol kinase